MNPLLEKIPPGRVWIETEDLPSARLALEVLLEHKVQQNDEQYPCDSDTL